MARRSASEIVQNATHVTMELQQSLPSLVDHLSDATAIKTKLEQEAIRYAAQLAEQVVQLSKVCTNIEIFRTKLDQITQQRRFCLASNEFYNELERLERLERELSAAKPVGATQFGYVNQKERNKQLQVEKLKDNQLHMYKNSCILARKLQHERNGIWEHLEVLITTRESEKIEVKRLELMLDVVRRSTGAVENGNTGTNSAGSGVRHARQLSSGDRERWTSRSLRNGEVGVDMDVDMDTDNEKEKEKLVLGFVSLPSRRVTADELKLLREKYREIPEWSKLLTLIKLKMEIDLRIERFATKKRRNEEKNNR